MFSFTFVSYKALIKQTVTPSSATIDASLPSKMFYHISEGAIQYDEFHLMQKVPTFKGPIRSKPDEQVPIPVDAFEGVQFDPFAFLKERQGVSIFDEDRLKSTDLLEPKLFLERLCYFLFRSIRYPPYKTSNNASHHLAYLNVYKRIKIRPFFVTRIPTGSAQTSSLFTGKHLFYFFFFCNQ